MPDRPRNPARDARQITIRGAREHALIGNILPIGLIPRPLGTKNLRNLLGKSRWTKLRRANLPTPLRCDVCNLLVRHSSELHAHEVWKYFARCKPAIAKLNQITFLCKTCHGCAHFSWDLNAIYGLKTERFEAELACLKKRIEQVILHYCRVNKISRKSFDRHLKYANAQLKRLSKIQNWIFDWGAFEPLVAAKKARDTAQKNKSEVKLFLDPVKDGEAPTQFASPARRGPKPEFGRPLTGAERQKRYRYRKSHGSATTIQDIKASKEAPVFVTALERDASKAHWHE